MAAFCIHHGLKEGPEGLAHLMGIVLRHVSPLLLHGGLQGIDGRMGSRTGLALKSAQDPIVERCTVRGWWRPVGGGPKVGQVGFAPLLNWVVMVRSWCLLLTQEKDPACPKPSWWFCHSLQGPWPASSCSWRGLPWSWPPGPWGSHCRWSSCGHLCQASWRGFPLSFSSSGPCKRSSLSSQQCLWCPWLPLGQNVNLTLSAFLLSCWLIFGVLASAVAHLKDNSWSCL